MKDTDPYSSSFQRLSWNDLVNDFLKLILQIRREKQVLIEIVNTRGKIEQYEIIFWWAEVSLNVFSDESSYAALLVERLSRELSKTMTISYKGQTVKVVWRTLENREMHPERRYSQSQAYFYLRQNTIEWVVAQDPDLPNHDMGVVYQEEHSSWANNRWKKDASIDSEWRIIEEFARHWNISMDYIHSSWMWDRVSLKQGTLTTTTWEKIPVIILEKSNLKQGVLRHLHTALMRWAAIADMWIVYDIKGEQIVVYPNEEERVILRDPKNEHHSRILTQYIQRLVNYLRFRVLIEHSASQRSTAEELADNLLAQSK